MFEFNNIENNKEEAIRLVNKIIMDEINYINGLCFIYAESKEKHPKLFKENLAKLLGLLSVLSDLKKEFDESVKEYGVYLDNQVYSLSKLMVKSETITSKNIDSIIEELVEESETNMIGMEQVLEFLYEIDERAFEDFASKIRDINEETVNYIVRSIGHVNKGKR